MLRWIRSFYHTGKGRFILKPKRSKRPWISKRNRRLRKWVKIGAPSVIRLERTNIQLMAVFILRHVRLNRTDLRSLHQTFLHFRRDTCILFIRLLLVSTRKKIGSEHFVEHIRRYFIRRCLWRAHFHQGSINSSYLLLAAFTSIASRYSFFNWVQVLVLVLFEWILVVPKILVLILFALFKISIFVLDFLIWCFEKVLKHHALMRCDFAIWELLFFDTFNFSAFSSSVSVLSDRTVGKSGVVFLSVSFSVFRSDWCLYFLFLYVFRFIPWFSYDLVHTWIYLSN